MRILFLDVETTGLLDQEPFRITEFAASIYDTVFKRCVGSLHIVFNDLEENQVLTTEIENLTGIKQGLLDTLRMPVFNVLREYNRLCNECDAVFASNGLAFDKKALEKEAFRSEFNIAEKIWIDDFYDIEYPAHHKGRNLGHKAADHGFLNPFPHNALGDVLTLIRIMELGNYDLHKAYESACTKAGTAVALVSFDQKDLAKNAGFQWDGDLKRWQKPMRQYKFEQVSSQWPFNCRFVES